MAGHYDAAIIGTGQAGPSLADRLTKAGIKTAVIERGRFGGTCVNTGCMPTKTLVASAYAARVAARASEYGITIGGPIGVDMKKVKARKDAVSRMASRNADFAADVLSGPAFLTFDIEDLLRQLFASHRGYLSLSVAAL